MIRCEFCKRRIWPWQKRVGPLHRVCVRIFADAYLRGIVAGYAAALNQEPTVADPDAAPGTMIQ